jgi:hypothetical protein
MTKQEIATKRANAFRRAAIIRDAKLAGTYTPDTRGGINRRVFMKEDTPHDVAMIVLAIAAITTSIILWLIYMGW